MESQLCNDFGLDDLVAKYALIESKYEGIEAALEVIFGSGDDDAIVKHRFFGYTPNDYMAPTE